MKSETSWIRLRSTPIPKPTNRTMTPEAQRIAIAKSVGIHLHDGDHAPSNYVFATDLPDYLNDLNVMHEAEKMLRKPMKGSDTDTIIGDRMHKYAELIGYAFDATAAQRAEAFLRTIGKWEDIKGTSV